MKQFQGIESVFWIYTEASLEQPSNADAPRVTELLMDISVREEHPLNAESLMKEMLVGRDTVFREAQFSNTDPDKVIILGMLIDSKLVHPLNADSPTEITVVGSCTVFREVQFSKDLGLSSFIPSFKIIDFTVWFPAKAVLRTVVTFQSFPEIVTSDGTVKSADVPVYPLRRNTELNSS